MREKHHIIPLHEWKRRFDPTATRRNKDFNALDNTVWLTTEQHAEAHKWLWEHYGHVGDKLAFQIKSGIIGKEELFLIMCSENGKKGRGRKQHSETKEKRRNLMLGNTLSKGRKQSPEHVEKRISKLRGRSLTPEMKARISTTLKGRTLGPHSISHNMKISLALKGRKIGSRKRNMVSGRFV